MAGSSDALKNFELENEIVRLCRDPNPFRQRVPSRAPPSAAAHEVLSRSAAQMATDKIYKYDHADVQKNLAGKPWTKDARYFKHVRISALALVKMVMHARSGGSLEIMGLMLGKIDPDDSRGPTMIVMDVFALPVEGTETRVNAQADAYEYMVEFLSAAKESGRLENVLGWYHSHPGYGCWLSGIDVSTQMLNQQYQEPWLAIVIDPHKTAATGKVDIGAFRTCAPLSGARARRRAHARVHDGETRPRAIRQRTMQGHVEPHAGRTRAARLAARAQHTWPHARSSPAARAHPGGRADAAAASPRRRARVRRPAGLQATRGFRVGV
jgi:proteasome lid subunit RPN8/RPN11